MENYCFDEIVNRYGSDCVKWDSLPEGTVPMWIADMDFKAAPAIRAALQKRLDHGVFGYELVPQAYYDAVSSWFSRRHGWKGIRKENVICTTGVIAAYSACIKAFTVPGDKVVVLTPCYNSFFPAIRNNKCEEVDCPLVCDGGRYSIDFEDLERKLSEPGVKVLLFCNPHNPVGRVWSREELLKVAEICYRHDVFVISDEIHCDITYEGFDYTPWGTLPEKYVVRSASCSSPTKPFNIAGIQIANIIAMDAEVYRKVDRAINDNECCDVNVFGVTALIAAYNESEGWLDAFRKYVWENYQFVLQYFKENLPEYKICPLEGTYLLWIDCRPLLKDGEPVEGFSDRLRDKLLEGYGLYVSSGTLYGVDGEGFLRFNLACPRSQVADALDRLKRCLLS